MDIYLIRHGECFDSAHEYFDAAKKTMNPQLTPKGIWQAEKLAERCAKIAFDAMITSDLSRAVQTAEKISEACMTAYRIDPALREIDMGDIHTKTWDDFPQIHAEWLLHDEDIPYPNGENGEDVWRRCKPQLDAVIEARYKNVAMVCHGGTIRSIICGVLGIPQQKRFCFGFPPENCSISIVKFDEGVKKFYLHTFNDYSHL